MVDKLHHQKFVYLDVGFIIKLNKVALYLFEQKKGDSFKVLSYSKLFAVVNSCKYKEGDFYDKATDLLIGITKAHVFASANRRTALLAIFVFALMNNHNVYIPDNPSNSKVLIGIREAYYSFEEVKTWIKNGKIRKFQR